MAILPILISPGGLLVSAQVAQEIIMRAHNWRLFSVIERGSDSDFASSGVGTC
jgi:hypothetical protein